MSEAVDAKTKDNEEETIPIIQLKVVSKKGTIPCKMSGSLKIPTEDMTKLELLTPDGVAGPPVNIVNLAQVPAKPKWEVLVNLSNDDLPEATVVKGKVCRKYICINALLSFDCSPTYTINEYIVKDNKELREEIVKALKCNKKDEIEHYLGLNCIRQTCLLSEDINPGEWLLPIKIKNGADGKLLAYVRVKIEDEPDEPASS